jgi:hypothetical protein
VIVIRATHSGTLHLIGEMPNGLSALKAGMTCADERPMRFLEPATFIGLGAVAIWLYIRFPRFRPATIVRAIIHVAASFFLFSLVPYGVTLCLRALPAPLSLFVFVSCMLIPTLGYVLLSWLWLIARLHDLGRPPRGGHPVPNPAR